MERVLRILGGDLHAPSLIAHVTIGRPRPPRDPGAVRVTHRWIQRRHETTGRLLDLDPMRAAHVLIRLSVRHEDELAIVQLVDEIEHGLLKLGNWYALLLAGARERAASCARQSYMESRALRALPFLTLASRLCGISRALPLLAPGVQRRYV